MPRSPALSFTLSATVYGGVAVPVGQVLLPDANGTYVPATAANRAALGRRSEAIALTPYGGTSPGGVQLQEAGTLDASLSGLGAGVASWVRCSAAGFPERFTPVNAGTSDIIGYCETDGRVHLQFGVLTETMLIGGGGGGFTPPTGTGFATVTLGVLDAAAKAGNASGGPLLAPAALVVGDMYYASSTSALSRIPVGSNGQMLTLVGGVPTWQSASFDPASLALTGYWKDYGGAPWLGSASAGPSAGRSLATGTAPSVGASFGAHPSAAFNGTTQSLLSPTLAYDSYLSTSGYYIECVFSVTATSAAGASPWGDQILVGDNQGNIYLGVSSSGIRCGHYDGAYKATSFIACPTATKHCAQVWYDGTTISLRLNGGTAVTVAAGNGALALSSCLPKLGAAFNGSAFLSGTIARVAMSNGQLSTTIRDQLRADAVANYGTV